VLPGCVASVKKLREHMPELWPVYERLVELDAGFLERNPQAVIPVQQRTREAGVLVRPLGTSVAVSPLLTIERRELQLIGEALTTAFEKPLETEPSPTSPGGTL